MYIGSGAATEKKTIRIFADTGGVDEIFFVFFLSVSNFYSINAKILIFTIQNCENGHLIIFYCNFFDLEMHWFSSRSVSSGLTFYIFKFFSHYFIFLNFGHNGNLSISTRINVFLRLFQALITNMIFIIFHTSI